ncbi:MBL fold metallo-hydrolase [Pseudomonas sp. MDT2-39-1]|uniref:MBL fold metallo-hydrolase n=1 Tax=Pseudomonas sp. BGI-2 TaxID=2528211 RepID=UPI001033DD8A|nr:MBL fold metallo-hydrolase [Pseudomonas sp. BGI-2]TBN41531.1 MBL fold metallo-hydrolase [Pseudomonas sp. BGI-2]
MDHSMLACGEALGRGRRLMAIVMLLAVIGGGVVACSTPSIEPYSALELRSSAPAAGALTARFMGVSTLMLSDGNTSIMTDGFFSRPGFLRVALGWIGPDRSRIDTALHAAGNPTLAAVMVAHAHYDHALDSAVVALRTGAVLVGSASVANIGSGEGLPPERIETVENKQSFEFGKFKVQVFPSPHSLGARYPGTIDVPLKQPARASEYKEGGNYSYLIEQSNGLRILIHPSANFTQGMFKNVKADVVFLGIGFLGKQDLQFARDYWHEVVQVTGARLVIPIHWDDFFEPLDKGLHPMPKWMDKFDIAMQRLMPMALADGVALRLMPLYKAIDLKAALPAR